MTFAVHGTGTVAFVPVDLQLILCVRWDLLCFACLDTGCLFRPGIRASELGMSHGIPWRQGGNMNICALKRGLACHLCALQETRSSSS